MALLKRTIAELTAKQDYNKLNTFFKRNPNASKLDTRTLKEDVPHDSKRFTKRNGKQCNVPPKSKQASSPQSDKHEAHLYDPNSYYILLIIYF